MALTPKDETVRLGFGADDKVKIARTVVRKAEGSAGVIWSSKTDEREFKIAVRNGHDAAVRITVEDQWSVSEIDDVKVEMLSVTTAPDERSLRNRRGVLAWTFDAAAGEAREIKFAWRVRWPADKAVIYEPAQMESCGLRGRNPRAASAGPSRGPAGPRPRRFAEGAPDSMGRTRAPDKHDLNQGVALIVPHP